MLMEFFQYILSFKVYVLLPILLFVFTMFFGLDIKNSVKACIKISIGFIGIFIVFGFFVESVGNVIEQMSDKFGFKSTILETGWPPLTTIAWGFDYAPILLVIFIGINFLMLITRMTNTLNIDIWNFWHFNFVGVLVYYSSQSIILALLAAILTSILLIKLGDMVATPMQKFTGIEGITSTTFTGLTYYPIAVLIDKFIDKVPKIKKIDFNLEKIQKSLGLFGETIILSFMVGLGFGIAGGYGLSQTLELAFNFAAFIYILPKMCEILSEGLIVISNGMKDFVSKKFKSREIFIGVDQAVAVGNPSIIITSLFLMPIIIGLSFVLPKVGFIPLGDTGNIIGAVIFIVIAVKGNIFRALIISLPIMIMQLYIATWMSPIFTSLIKPHREILKGYDGAITSLNDGGHVVRYIILWLFSEYHILLSFVAGILFVWLVWKLVGRKRLNVK